MNDGVVGTVSEEHIQRFLDELTALSVRYGIAISGSPALFLLEREDSDSVYSINDASELTFG